MVRELYGWSKLELCAENGRKQIPQGLAMTWRATRTKITKIRYESRKSTLAGIQSMMEQTIDGMRFLGR